MNNKSGYVLLAINKRNTHKTGCVVLFPCNKVSRVDLKSSSNTRALVSTILPFSHLLLPLSPQMLDYLERKGLEEEGLLRKCGSTTRVKSMADTVELMFNCGVFSLNDYMTSDKERKISDVASLLKQFFRCALYGMSCVY